MAVQTTQSLYSFTTETPELLSDGIACFQADDALTLRYLNPSLMDFLGLSALPAGLKARGRPCPYPLPVCRPPVPEAQPDRKLRR